MRAVTSAKRRAPHANIRKQAEAQTPLGATNVASKSLKDDWGASSTEGADCEGDYSLIEITARNVKIPTLSVCCVIRKITKFDVCPWGMIFRDRQRAQINPWSPGFHIVLQCTGGPQQPETMENDWVIEKGSIRVGMPRDYRCPWDRKVSR